jgi:chloramphenicol 3-O-phosphotransferase
VFFPLAAPADRTNLDVVTPAVQHFGEFLAAVSRSLNDGHMSAADAEAILPETEDVVAVLVPFARALQGVIVEDETVRERTRRGPHRAPSSLSELRNKALRISVA